MPLASLVLAAAVAAAPRAPVVSQTDLTRLLRGEYDGEKPRLRGDWPGRSDEGSGAMRALCADGGVQPGPRLVAVCTSYGDAGHATPGRVDLFVLEPAASRRERARVRTRFRGIATGGFGNPGAVRLVAIGPAATAFAVTSGFSNMGWLDERVTLYVEQNGRLRPLLDVATAASNGGVCTPGDDPAGRRCRRQSIDLTCTLRADPSRVDAGRYPLELHVTGERAGERVDRTIRIPHDAYGYRISARVLQTQGCNVQG